MSRIVDDRVFVDRGTAEWDLMWQKLARKRINRSLDEPTVADNYGETWQYMESVPRKSRFFGTRMLHGFRHRLHPVTGGRVCFWIRASKRFSSDDVDTDAMLDLYFEGFQRDIRAWNMESVKDLDRAAIEMFPRCLGPLKTSVPAHLRGIYRSPEYSMSETNSLAISSEMLEILAVDRSGIALCRSTVTYDYEGVDVDDYPVMTLAEASFRVRRLVESRRSMDKGESLVFGEISG